MNTSIDGFYARVALGFARKTDTNLIAFTRNVVALLTGNETYPSPMPTLAILVGSVNTFETAVHEALNGGKLLIAARNAARLELLALLRQLAAYVQANCGAELLALLTSGFEAVRAPSPVGLLPAPGNLRLSFTGLSGELLLRFDRVINAYNYSIQTSNSPDGPWEDQDLSTSVRVTVGGLTPGEVYWMRACANGSAGASEWGGPASSMAV